MNAPRRVIVGVHEFKVFFSTKKLLEHVQENKDDCYGYTDVDRLEIVIDERSPLTRQKEILLHEILHCCIWAYSIDVPVEQRTEDTKAQDGARDVEEKLIQQVTTPLMLVFRQNPGVFSWILEKEKANGS